LAKYYLVTARPLNVVWTNGDPSDNPAPLPCGVNNLARCQDYNLEYDTAGTEKSPRAATDTPYMYKWDSVGKGWSVCGSGIALAGGLACPGAPTFSVARADDLIVSGTGDTSHVPFNTKRVP